MGNAEGQLDDAAATHEVKLAATGFLTVAGVTAYHTSVIVDDMEYLFDSMGIMSAPPLWSHAPPESKKQRDGDDDHDRQTEVLPMGTSVLSGLEMAKVLHPHFRKGTYDVLYKNCNHFTDCALAALLMIRLPGKYSRGERFITATDPISTGLMNRAFKMFIERKTGNPCDANIYQTNPLAEDFSVREVIDRLDEADEEDEEQLTPGRYLGLKETQTQLRKTRVGEDYRVITMLGKDLAPRLGEKSQAFTKSASLTVQPGMQRNMHGIGKHMPGRLKLTLEKPPTSQWGMSLDCSLHTNLLVLEVFDGGVVSRYNALHPEEALEAGDFIEEVNFENKSALAMAEIVKRHDKLHLVVRKHWCPTSFSMSGPSLSRQTPAGSPILEQRGGSVSLSMPTTSVRRAVSGCSVSVPIMGASVSASASSAPVPIQAVHITTLPPVRVMPSACSSPKI